MEIQSRVNENSHFESPKLSAFSGSFFLTKISFPALSSIIQKKVQTLCCLALFCLDFLHLSYASDSEEENFYPISLSFSLSSFQSKQEIRAKFVIRLSKCPCLICKIIKLAPLWRLNAFPCKCFGRLVVCQQSNEHKWCGLGSLSVSIWTSHFTSVNMSKWPEYRTRSLRTQIN